MPKILISFILLGFSLVLGVFFLQPKYKEMETTQTNITNKEQEIKNLDKYYKELTFISEILDKHPQELAKIDSALPTNPPLPSLLKFLQKITSENGLILTSINFASAEPTVGTTNIKEIQASLELSGSYSSLKNFLKVLEKSSRLIEVDNISFSVSQDKGGNISEILKFSLSIRTKSY